MFIVIKGIVKNTSQWIELARVEASLDATSEDVHNLVNVIRSNIKSIFETGESGFVSVNGTIIDVQAFAVIEVQVV